MLSFATELSQLVHSVGDLDTIAVKVASADISATAQRATSQASSQLYSVITKKAEFEHPEALPKHRKVVALTEKLAQVLRRKQISPEMRCKIAAVVAADDAIADVIRASTSQTEQSKLAEVQAYGREFFIELLKGVI